jgi:hypothetical protein
LERMAGLEPAPQGLEGPQAAVTPHSRWFGLRVSNPSLRAGNAGCLPPHPGRTWTGALRRPIDISSVFKDPALSSWWAARDSNPIAPWGRTGLRPVSGPSARTARLAKAPGFEPVAVVRTHRPSSEDRTSPRPDMRFFRASGPKQKRPSRGSPQKACYSMNAGLLRRFVLRIKHAAAVAIGPGLCHEPIHTGGRSLGADQREWPS